MAISWWTYSTVFSANRSSSGPMCLRASSMAAPSVSTDWRVPLATTAPPTITSVPSTATGSPSRTASNTPSPTSSMRGMPAWQISSGPRLG